MSAQSHRQAGNGSSQPEGTLLSKLERIYGHTGTATDQFGRRQALPSEIERVVRKASGRERGSG